MNGQAQLAQLVAFQANDTDGAEPKAVIKLLEPDAEHRTIDLGQITTIWDDPRDLDDNEKSSNLSAMAKEQVHRLPDGFLERKLDALYLSHVGRARSSRQGLSKKQVTKYVQKFAELDRSHAENVLRNAVKAGTHLSRLIDSSMARQAIFGPTKTQNSKNDIGCQQQQQQQACAAYSLALDAQLGGRFKRWPCLFVGQQQLDNNNKGEDKAVSVTLINGGWLVLDRSVRAGNEARKFVERSSVSSLSSPQNGGQTILTRADERILRRLECLAMGEQLSGSNTKNNSINDVGRCNDRKLELDVRETLNGMKLPVSSDGAKSALIRLGRWTGEDNGFVHFWPKPVLEAASWYVQYSKKRRQQGRDMIEAENRVDLTSLPSISVDAQRVAFRDDAIGVRARAATGRRVVQDASKWEILVHIADTSDIFVPETVPDDLAGHMSILRTAAESRGTSRYDLPSGPLHLLPPVVLGELSLSCKNASNRCVTLWVYIDERTGRLLDAGIERTLISAPVELSFSEASNIMSNKDDLETKKVRTVLLVAERNLGLWAKCRLERSEVARNREKRLSNKESESPFLEGIRDDGTEGFFRSRGHRLVDSVLDVHAYAVAGLLRRAEAPIPRARGADGSRGGRLATSPLRRFIDAQGQRQALAVCCRFGRPLTARECRETGKKANKARNAISNIRAIRDHQ